MRATHWREVLQLLTAHLERHEQHVAAMLYRTSQLLAMTGPPRSAAEARRLRGMLGGLARTAAGLLPSPGMGLREIATISYALVRLRHPVGKPYYIALMTAAQKRLSAARKAAAHRARQAAKRPAGRPALTPPPVDGVAASPATVAVTSAATGAGGSAAQCELRPYTALDLAQLLWSVSRCGMERLRRDWAAEFNAALLPVVPELSPQGVSTVLCGMARLRSPPPPELLAALCGRLVELMADGSAGEAAAGSSAAGAASSTGECCTAEARPAEQFLAAEDAAAGGSPEGAAFVPTAAEPPPASLCRPSDVALSLWALATLRLPPGSVCPALLPAAERYSACRIADFHPQDLSTLTWAMARLQHSPDPDWIQSLYGAVLGMLYDVQPQALSTLLYSLAQMGQRPGDEWLAAVLRRAAERLPYFTQQALALTIHALAIMDYRPEASWLAAFHAQLEAHRGQLDTRVRDKARGDKAPSPPASSIQLSVGGPSPQCSGSGGDVATALQLPASHAAAALMPPRAASEGSRAIMRTLMLLEPAAATPSAEDPIPAATIGGGCIDSPAAGDSSPFSAFMPQPAATPPPSVPPHASRSSERLTGWSAAPLRRDAARPSTSRDGAPSPLPPRPVRRSLLPALDSAGGVLSPIGRATEQQAAAAQAAQAAHAAAILPAATSPTAATGSAAVGGAASWLLRAVSEGGPRGGAPYAPPLSREQYQLSMLRKSARLQRRVEELQLRQQVELRQQQMLQQGLSPLRPATQLQPLGGDSPAAAGSALVPRHASSPSAPAPPQLGLHSAYGAAAATAAAAAFAASPQQLHRQQQQQQGGFHHHQPLAQLQAGGGLPRRAVSLAWGTLARQLPATIPEEMDELGTTPSTSASLHSVATSVANCALPDPPSTDAGSASASSASLCSSIAGGCGGAAAACGLQPTLDEIAASLAAAAASVAAGSSLSSLRSAASCSHSPAYSCGGGGAAVPVLHAGGVGAAGSVLLLPYSSPPAQTATLQLAADPTAAVAPAPTAGVAAADAWVPRDEAGLMVCDWSHFLALGAAGGGAAATCTAHGHDQTQMADREDSPTFVEQVSGIHETCVGVSGSSHGHSASNGNASGGAVAAGGPRASVEITTPLAHLAASPSAACGLEPAGSAAITPPQPPTPLGGSGWSFCGPFTTAIATSAAGTSGSVTDSPGYGHHDAPPPTAGSAGSMGLSSRAAATISGAISNAPTAAASFAAAAEHWSCRAAATATATANAGASLNGSTPPAPLLAAAAETPDQPEMYCGGGGGAQDALDEQDGMYGLYGVSPFDCFVGLQQQQQLDSGSSLSDGDVSGAETSPWTSVMAFTTATAPIHETVMPPPLPLDGLYSLGGGGAVGEDTELPPLPLPPPAPILRSCSVHADAYTAHMAEAFQSAASILLPSATDSSFSVAAAGDGCVGAAPGAHNALPPTLTLPSGRLAGSWRWASPARPPAPSARSSSPSPSLSPVSPLSPLPPRRPSSQSVPRPHSSSGSASSSASTILRLPRPHSGPKHGLPPPSPAQRSPCSPQPDNFLREEPTTPIRHCTSHPMHQPLHQPQSGGSRSPLPLPRPGRTQGHKAPGPDVPAGAAPPSAPLPPQTAEPCQSAHCDPHSVPTPPAEMRRSRSERGLPQSGGGGGLPLGGLGAYRSPSSGSGSATSGRRDGALGRGPRPSLRSSVPQAPARQPACAQHGPPSPLTSISSLSDGDAENRYVEEADLGLAASPLLSPTSAARSDPWVGLGRSRNGGGGGPAHFGPVTAHIGYMVMAPSNLLERSLSAHNRAASATSATSQRSSTDGALAAAAAASASATPPESASTSALSWDPSGLLRNLSVTSCSSATGVRPSAPASSSLQQQQQGPPALGSASADPPDLPFKSGSCVLPGVDSSSKTVSQAAAAAAAARLAEPLLLRPADMGPQMVPPLQLQLPSSPARPPFPVTLPELAQGEWQQLPTQGTSQRRLFHANSTSAPLDNIGDSNSKSAARNVTPAPASNMPGAAASAARDRMAVVAVPSGGGSSSGSHDDQGAALGASGAATGPCGIDGARGRPGPLLLLGSSVASSWAPPTG
ncbi:hypothetical protein GPECTOR_7g908 [Gonium pectorale]|uniref:Uncharacterized protein n=1 Tax=Gonium pectorale TaxID=33097 RepID=A0A150GUT8_GONPE|nr:hypothetical protein GPECTOR_7g908 [Gonium pectorale]|eukprot:KXZ53458.1 hypothetical protein GPECTOR_7g908 [Gonium pectorale]